MEYSGYNPDDPSRSPAESKEADYQINAGNGRPVYFNDSLCGLALILNRFVVTASVSILSADGAFFVDIEKSFETSSYGIGVYDEEYSESDYNEHDPGAKRLVSEGDQDIRCPADYAQDNTEGYAKCSYGFETALLFFNVSCGVHVDAAVFMTDEGPFVVCKTGINQKTDTDRDTEYHQTYAAQNFHSFGAKDYDKGYRYNA